jgi:hypothetical protein
LFCPTACACSSLIPSARQGKHAGLTLPHAPVPLFYNCRALFALSTELLPEERPSPAPTSGSTSSPSSGGDGDGFGARGPGGYLLQPTGRYAHSPLYIASAGARAGWRVAALQTAVIRVNAGRPINGNLAVLERLGGGAAEPRG